MGIEISYLFISTVRANQLGVIMVSKYDWTGERTRRESRNRLKAMMVFVAVMAVASVWLIDIGLSH